GPARAHAHTNPFGLQLLSLLDPPVARAEPLHHPVDVANVRVLAAAGRAGHEIREDRQHLVACPQTFDRKWRFRLAAMHRPQSPEYSQVFGLPASSPDGARSTPFPGQRSETDHYAPISTVRRASSLTSVSASSASGS